MNGGPIGWRESKGDVLTMLAGIAAAGAIDVFAWWIGIFGPVIMLASVVCGVTAGLTFNRRIERNDSLPRCSWCGSRPARFGQRCAKCTPPPQARGHMDDRR